MRRVVSLVVATIVAALSNPVSAATLAKQGNVLVNGGQGFSAASPGQEIKPGDTVLVKDGGNARISYAGGCAMQLQVSGVFTVPTEEQCITAQNSVTNLTSNTPLNLTPLNVTLGTIAIGGIVAGAILLSADDKSSSP